MRRLTAAMLGALLLLAGCGTDGDADDDSDADQSSTRTATSPPGEAGDGDAGSPADVPTSEEICAAIVAPLEQIYGTATEQEPDDGSYPACKVDMPDARVVVSAFALDDPLVGGSFDEYVEEVGETIKGLEPLDGVGDAAVGNKTGNAFVLLGEVILTVSRAFHSADGDPADLTDVTAAVADALA